jgi:hypothetical protein
MEPKNSIHTYKITSMNPILSQMNIYSYKHTYFSKSNFNVLLSFNPMSPN